METIRSFSVIRDSFSPRPLAFFNIFVNGTYIDDGYSNLFMMVCNEFERIRLCFIVLHFIQPFKHAQHSCELRLPASLHYVTSHCNRDFIQCVLLSGCVSMMCVDISEFIHALPIVLCLMVANAYQICCFTCKA